MATLQLAWTAALATVAGAGTAVGATAEIATTATTTAAAAVTTTTAAMEGAEATVAEEMVAGAATDAGPLALQALRPVSMSSASSPLQALSPSGLPILLTLCTLD